MSSKPALVLCAAAMLGAGVAPAGAYHDPRAAVEVGEIPAPLAVLPWFNGTISNVGTNIACLSDPPITQVRVQGYAGWTLVPPNRTPAVGEVFYTHVVLSHPGNPCAGSAVGIELLLPPGVQTATSAADPAFCFAITPPNPNRPFAQLFNLGIDPAYGCPQTFAQGLEGLRVTPPQGGLGGAWGMAQGFLLEFLIPLRSNVVQPGNTSIRFRVNPDIGVVGYVSQTLLVNNDVLFRSMFEDNQLTLDICTITPAAGC